MIAEIYGKILFLTMLYFDGLMKKCKRRTKREDLKGSSYDEAR